MSTENPVIVLPHLAQLRIRIFVEPASMLKKFRRDLVTLTAIWFVLPAAMVVLMSVNQYNDFRQFFFILPPVFLIAGLGLDWVFTIFRRPVSRLVILYSRFFQGCMQTLLFIRTSMFVTTG